MAHGSNAHHADVGHVAVLEELADALIAGAGQKYGAGGQRTMVTQASTIVAAARVTAVASAM